MHKRLRDGGVHGGEQNTPPPWGTSSSRVAPAAPQQWWRTSFFAMHEMKCCASNTFAALPSAHRRVPTSRVRSAAATARGEAGWDVLAPQAESFCAGNPTHG